MVVRVTISKDKYDEKMVDRLRKLMSKLYNKTPKTTIKKR